MNWIKSLNDTYSKNSLFKENFNTSKSIKQIEFRVKIFLKTITKETF